MIVAGNPPFSAASAEDGLRARLADCDAALDAFTPTLLGLLGGGDNSTLNEEILARVRGMISDVAEQLLLSQAEAALISDIASYVEDYRSGLAERLASNGNLLRHFHSMAVEGNLCEKMQLSRSLDPVLPPLLQELISSHEERISALAMAVLSSQARFVDAYRKMKFPLRELPGAMEDLALGEFRANAEETDREGVNQTIEVLRDRRDDSTGRISLLTQLVLQLGKLDDAVLSIDRAGISLFSSALAVTTHQPREIVVLSTSEGQLPRLAVLLGAAGLASPAIAQQLFALHPNAPLLDGFEQLTTDAALAALADSSLDRTG